MNQKKLGRIILFLLTSGVVFLFLLGYLNLAIFQLRQDKLTSEAGQIASETFFAIPYNTEGLQLFVQEISNGLPEPPDDAELHDRFSNIFKNYASSGDSLFSILHRKGIPAAIKWSVSISSFEVRMKDVKVPVIIPSEGSNQDLILFGDLEIGPKAEKYLFYKINENYFCQINLYLEITNSFGILRLQMLLVFIIDFILILLFGGALLYTIRAFQQQQKVTNLQADFINGVSHEFNTPLSSIQLAGQALLKLEADQVLDKRDEIANLILRQQNYLRKMVDQVLTVAVSENPFTSLDFDWLPVPDQLVKMVDDWHQSHLHILVDYKLKKLEGMWAKIDPFLLIIVVHNILDNAVKYNQSAEPEISISDIIQGDQYIFKIKDNGIGIPAGELKVIFKKFHRGSSVNSVKAKGLGLGLYLVRLIIELHDGKVSIVSEIGHGTEISISIPIKHERAI